MFTQAFYFIATFVVAAQAFVGPAQAPFRPSSFSPTLRKQVALNAWGVQKLGQTIINYNSTAVQTVVADEASVLRFRPSVGSGDDERNFGDAQVDFENDVAIVSRIDLGFKQQRLLSGLKGSDWSHAYKLEMIGSGMGAENLIPVSFTSGASPRMATPLGAGLMDDWNLTF